MCLFQEKNVFFFFIFSLLLFLAMLMYRTCRCCRRIWSKLLHTLFHLLATPCIAFAFIAVWDSHAYRKPEPIPHFYSLHSWMGATTMGLFALQVLMIIIIKIMDTSGSGDEITWKWIWISRKFLIGTSYLLKCEWNIPNNQ